MATNRPFRSCLLPPGVASPSYPRPRQRTAKEQGEWTRFGDGHSPDRQNPQDTVSLVVGTGGEVDTVHAAPTPVVTGSQRPQTVYHKRLAVRTLQLPREAAGAQVESADRPVAEVAHEQIACECAELGGSQRQTPGRIQ